MSKQLGNYMALDFGAESGRAIIVTLENGKVSLEEIHRFPNNPSLMNGTLYWDLPFLFREIVTSLKKASRKGIELDSVAVDTWGVDFGLLDTNNELLSNPVHYRDERTASIKDHSPMTDEDLFVATGGLPWNIGSLFQMYSLVKSNSSQLKLSGTFLNIPDLFNFLLCGVKASEVTIASSSIIMGKDSRWNDDIINKFNLPDIFPHIVQPAHLLGNLRDEIAEKTGYKNLKVLTTCSHDTASVAAVVPDRKDSSAFLSSGTWSILGKIIDDPQTDPESMEAGFTNEASLESWYLCKNITGLYPFQELKRLWDLSDDPWDYSLMCEEASKAESIGFVDLEHIDFQSPGKIINKIEKHLKHNNFPAVNSRGEVARIILDSLALEYAVNLKKLASISHEDITNLYILGGGIRNRYLCQKTADMCRVKVIAGIDQGTALGNGLVQAYGLGHIDSTEQIRRIAMDSFEMKIYTPENNQQTEKQVMKYIEIKNRSSEV